MKTEIKEKTQVPVIVDRNRTLNYETRNWIMKILRVPIMLILNMLPKKIGRLLFIASKGTRVIYEHATTYKALEILYTYPERRRKREFGLTDVLWGEFFNNSPAVRNRLKLVKHELIKVIKNNKHKTRIRLMSLGSGSARAIVEALAQLNGIPSVETKLIDISRDAINFSKELALHYGLDKIEYHRDYIQNLEKYCDGFQPDIVEMVGILDYCSDKIAIDLISRVYQVLATGGYLITGNICPNLEQPFVTKAINWVMIYRTPQELGEIVVKGGFTIRNVRIILEPLGIHAVAICQKIV